MIVPHSRLLFWVTIVVLPFSIVAAIEPQAFALAAGAVGVLFVLAILDAAFAFRVLDGIRVRIPEIVRGSKDRALSLGVQIENPSETAKTIRIALGFPDGITSATEEMRVLLPAGRWSSFVWPCLPTRRGQYQLRQSFVGGRSPLGFWHRRQMLPLQGEVRIYPNLMPERKNLAALFLNRSSFGLHAQRQMGKGREFEKLREYTPGDSYEDIHWKTTAKRGRPVTKLFQVERTQEIYVVIDTSRLSAIRAGIAASDTALERFVTAALVLGLAAEKQGDLFGLITFANNVDHFVRAQTGKSHYHICRDTLYSVQSRESTPDFDELMSFIRLRLRRRALLLFLTSLDDPIQAESFIHSVDLIRQQHLVLVNMLQPLGAGPVFKDQLVGGVDEIYERLGGHLRWQKLRQLERVLHRRNVRFSLLENEKLAVEMVSQYLGVKQKQLL